MGTETAVTRRRHVVHVVHLDDVLRAGWCRWIRAIFPSSFSFPFSSSFFFSDGDAGQLFWTPCSEDFDHHDLHLMSIAVAVAVAVAACSLREGVGVEYLEVLRISGTSTL